MGKEGKANIKFIVSVLFFLMVMGFLAVAIVEFNDAVVRAPANNYINISRNINFTFNASWTGIATESIGNCSLWTNFTGTWAETQVNDSKSGNIMNGTIGMSNINYTFPHDIGLMEWAIACRNSSSGDILNLTSSAKWTLAIDTDAPIITASPTFYNILNTTDQALTITVNITDVNGTGVNLTVNNSQNGDNMNLNFSLYNYAASGGSLLKKYNISSSLLTCTSSGSGVQFTQCSLDLSTAPLTNGTKNITVSVTDRAGWTNVTSFLFIVDQIPPVFDTFNITNSSDFNTTPSVGDGTVKTYDNTPGGSIIPGSTFFLRVNWTDNLTQPLRGDWQVLNGSTWVTINTSDIAPKANAGWLNLSFTIPTGHNLYEGRNVSFRIRGNDTLGNMNTSTTYIIVQVNDTAKPTISISQENGTNYTTSNRDIAINWSILEGNFLVAINWTVDDNKVGEEAGSGCNDFGKFNTQANAEDNRNYNFTLYPSSKSCTELANGTHYLVINARDSWNNIHKYNYTFTIQSGRTPVFVNSTLQSGISGFGGTTNVTPYTGINFTVGDGLTRIKNMSWISTCNSTVQVINGEQTINNSFIWPFNYTNCKRGGDDNSGGEANLTVNVTACDFGTPASCRTETYQFAVDDLAPTLYVKSPTAGLRASGLFEFNVSAFDQMNRVAAVGYYLDGSNTITNHSMNTTAEGALLATHQGENVTGIGVSVNFTAGAHTIKFRVNDSLGNYRNSSEITFTVLGPINFAELDLNTTLRGFNENVSLVNLTNASGAPIYDVTRTVTDQTLNLFMALNRSSKGVNVTISFNASAANWDNYNFSIVQNESTSMDHIVNNWTTVIFDTIYVNSSLSNFISDDDYYGKIKMPMNVTANGLASGGKLGIWYFEDELDLTTRTAKLGECAATFSPTNTDFTACWNNTEDNSSIDIFVPHFSIIAFTNNTGAPTLNVTIPADANQTVGSFLPNITVSSDAVNCTYHLNNTPASSTANKSMTLTGTKCIGTAEEHLLNGPYNITFHVADEDNNLNTYLWAFNVSDYTAPNSGTSISASASVTTATITISGVNESVNATVFYSTTNTTFTSSFMQTTFSSSPSVSLTGLTASTKYYYNVTLYDYNGNSVFNSTVFSFTTSAAVTPPVTPPAAAGGGGGAVPTSNVLDSRGQMWGTVPEGSSVSLNINRETIAVTTVAVNEVKSELRNLDITVKSLKSKPISAAAAAKVYQYLQITKKNLADTDAGSIKIGFRVTKAWLTENGLASADIRLYRYKNSVWNRLVTTVAGTDSTYVNFEAETPGLSFFAIGTKAGVEVPEEVSEEVPVEEVPGEVAPPEEVEAPTPIVAPGKSPIAWVIAIVVVILGIVLIAAYQKKKQQV